MRDPWVPPESRRDRVASNRRGCAARQVERKLKRAFDDADVGRTDR